MKKFLKIAFASIVGVAMLTGISACTNSTKSASSSSSSSKTSQSSSSTAKSSSSSKANSSSSSSSVAPQPVSLTQQVINILAQKGLQNIHTGRFPDGDTMSFVEDNNVNVDDYADTQTGATFGIEANIPAGGIILIMQVNSTGGKAYIVCEQDIPNTQDAQTAYQNFGEDGNYLFSKFSEFGALASNGSTLNQNGVIKLLGLGTLDSEGNLSFPACDTIQ